MSVSQSNRVHVPIILILLASGTPVSAQGDSEDRIGLPRDPQTPVIELFTSSGRADSRRPDRMLVVTADGTVAVAAGNGVARQSSARLSRDELLDLLSDLISTHRILQCRSDQLLQEAERAGRAAGLDWKFPKATTTIIRIRLSGGVHEVRCTAAELLAERFPDAESVQNFNGALLRLQNLIAITQIGGAAEAQRLCDIANSELRVTGDRRNGVTARDIQSVRENRQGLRLVQFHLSQDDNGDSPNALISVVESQDSPAQVTITPLPRRER